MSDTTPDDSSSIDYTQPFETAALADPQNVMQFNPTDPNKTIDPLRGGYHGESSECVASVKALHNLGPTPNWSPLGPIGTDTQVGAPIAIFNGQGKYMNTPGTSHAATFLGLNPDGSMMVGEQANGMPWRTSNIPFNGQGGERDGFSYQVIGDKSNAPTSDSLAAKVAALRGSGDASLPAPTPDQTAPTTDSLLAKVQGLAQGQNPAAATPAFPMMKITPTGASTVDTQGNAVAPVGSNPEPPSRPSDAYTYLPPGSGPQANANGLPNIQQAGASVADAAKSAYSNTPNLLSPPAQSWLDSTSPLAGGLVHGANVLMGGLNAGYKGAQEALVQAGVPKDVVSIPDAFAGMPNALRTPTVDRMTLAADKTVPAPVPPEVTQGAVNPRQYYPDTGESAPAQAGGAAATPADQAAMSDRELAAYKKQGDQQLLTQPASDRATNGVDTTEYVKGSVPTQAEYDTNSNATQQRADLEKPEFSGQQTARLQANNQARVDHFDTVAGSPVTTLRLEEDREANGNAALTDAWNGRIATNAQPVVDTIDSILKSPDGKLSPVQDALNQVKSKLYVGEDPTNGLEQDPQQLYGVRKQINNMLSTRYQRQNPTAADAAPQLQQVMQTLDNTIEQGAPGYQAYKAQWAQDSAPIDVEKYLQDKRASLFDGNNNMTPNRVQTMMKSIVADRTARGANAAKNITDDQMSSLWDLRNDLQRRSNIDLGKARGSTTNQIANASGGILTRTLGQIGTNALSAGRIAALNTAGEAIHPGLGYALNSVVETNRLIRNQNKAQQAVAAQQAADRSALENRVAGYFQPPPGWNHNGGPPMQPGE